MSEFPRLSNREWDVLKLLLQGKSNKLIASSLDISVRTVEFHLKNIYAKFQVNSRIELILILVNATGGIEIEKLGYSTVAGTGESTENRDILSMIGKELEVKNLLKSTHVVAGIVAALLTGFLWVTILEYSGNLSVEDFTVFTIPLVIVLALIGLIIGAVGKQRGETLVKVLFSAISGTGLSPFTVIPLMMFVVIPIGRLVSNIGVFDPSIIPAETASTIAMGIMITMWLIVSIIFGIVLLMLTIKLRSTSNHSQIEGGA